MKIGVIADTHIPDRAKDIPQKVLEAFKQMDMVIHAGDLVDIKVIDELKKVCKNVKAVCGNMDPDDIRKILPEKTIIKAGAFKIGVMHGYGSPSNLIEILGGAFKQDKVDIIIFGHSHVPLSKKVGKIIFFNPGSATDRMFSPYNSYGIIQLNGKIKTRIVKI